MVGGRLTDKVLPFKRRGKPGPSERSGAKDAAKCDKAFEQIYRTHYASIISRLRSVFGAGPPEPEDLAQEAFVKFSMVSNIDDIDHPKAFIFRTALNLGFNASKRLGVARRFIEQALREADASILEELSPEDVYSSRERLKVLITAAEALSDKQRTILARSRIHGETYAEISASTGWSQADISRQLNQALEILQERLRAADGDDV